MIQTHGTAAAPDRIGVLAHDFRTRILNCSPAGCLLETTSPIEVGTVASLRLVLDGGEFADHVQVVRCQSIEGAGQLFQIGVRFLWAIAPGARSLRYAFSRTAAERAAGSAG